MKKPLFQRRHYERIAKCFRGAWASFTTAHSEHPAREVQGTLPDGVSNRVASNGQDSGRLSLPELWEEVKELTDALSLDMGIRLIAHGSKLPFLIIGRNMVNSHYWIRSVYE